VTADCLADYIRPPASNLRLWSNRSGRLFVPRSKTAAEDQSIAVAGPRLWNSLPASVTSAGSMAVFKITIKEILVLGCIWLMDMFSHLTLFCFVSFVKQYEATCRLRRHINCHYFIHYILIIAKHRLGKLYLTDPGRAYIYLRIPGVAPVRTKFVVGYPAC